MSTESRPAPADHRLPEVASTPLETPLEVSPNAAAQPPHDGPWRQFVTAPALLVEIPLALALIAAALLASLPGPAWD